MRYETSATHEASLTSADAVLRWAVHTTSWHPSEAEWRFLTHLLDAESAAEVERFKFDADRKRALVSRLLQRRCAVAALGLSEDQIVIKRTKGRKPFLATPVTKPHAPNFNFNVSHEGDYVVLASEPVCVCGVDVAAPQQLRKSQAQTLEDVLDVFKDQFTPFERETMRKACSNETGRLQVFQRFWSLKEAFVKARGDGLGFDFRQCEFDFGSDPFGDVATVRLHRQPTPRWHFTLQRLGLDHWVSVARGPPEGIVDAWGEFTATFKRPQMADEEYQVELHAPSPPFCMLSIADLLPGRLRSGYVDAGGEIF